MRTNDDSPTTALHAALDALAAQQVTPPSAAADARDELLRLLAASHRLHAELARRVAAFDAEGSSAADGFRSTHTWLRAFGRLSHPSASRMVKAGRLLRELPVLAAAAGAGEVSAEHVQRIDRLAERAGLATVRTLERPLTELAARVDPATLEKACARVSHHTDADRPTPDPGAGFDRRGVTLAPVDGMLTIRGQLDPEGGAALRAALDALLSSARADDDRRSEQRRADALVELARGALRAGRLPEVGGERPQVGILVTPRHLVSPPRSPDRRRAVVAGGPASRAAWLERLGDIPDEVAQRVACDADVWRAVLDPANGAPLQLGRAQRVVPPWLRKALWVRDGGCAFPHCEAPAAWTDAHHLVAWARGGRTDLENLVLLCRHHHSLVHEGRWHIARDPASGVVRVWPPGADRFSLPRLPGAA